MSMNRDEEKDETKISNEYSSNCTHERSRCSFGNRIGYNY